MKEPIRILLADDDADDRFFFQKALKEVRLQTELSMVSDGEQLMSFLEKNVDHLPSVIFLDINMPRKTGKECLAEIKNDSRFSSVPVVIYSTSLSEDVADEFYKAGAHYYFQKCDFSELAEGLTKILNLLLTNSEQPGRNDFIIRTLVV